MHPRAFHQRAVQMQPGFSLGAIAAELNLPRSTVQGMLARDQGPRTKPGPASTVTAEMKELLTGLLRGDPKRMVKDLHDECVQLDPRVSVKTVQRAAKKIRDQLKKGEPTVAEDEPLENEIPAGDPHAEEANETTPGHRQTARQAVALLSEQRDRDEQRRISCRSNRRNFKIVRTGDQKGLGVSTLRPFKKGDRLMCYVGERRMGKKAVRKVKDAMDDDDFPPNIYPFFVDDKIVILGDRITDDPAVFVNHDNTNANLFPRLQNINGQSQLVFVVSRDIAINEQLSYDYNEQRPEVLAAQPWLQ